MRLHDQRKMKDNTKNSCNFWNCNHLRQYMVVSSSCYDDFTRKNNDVRPQNYFLVYRIQNIKKYVVLITKIVKEE